MSLRPILNPRSENTSRQLSALNLHRDMSHRQDRRRRLVVQKRRPVQRHLVEANLHQVAVHRHALHHNPGRSHNKSRKLRGQRREKLPDLHEGKMILKVSLS